jgi:hypothetical protein
MSLPGSWALRATPQARLPAQFTLFPQFAFRKKFVIARARSPVEVTAIDANRPYPCYIASVRYLVKGRVRMGKESALLRAIDQGTLGNGSIAGDEYLYDMEQARLNQTGVAQWVETCFCDPPLAEERPYWEEYFELLSVKDAHSRRNCRHENGTEPWRVATAIALKSSRKNCELKARHFSTCCAHRRAISRLPLQLRLPSRYQT